MYGFLLLKIIVRINLIIHRLDFLSYLAQRGMLLLVSRKGIRFVMSYQALYRKWRPLSFSDVVGQQHIIDTLKNEVKSGKIAHAYLFCGTRGTGKTTTAKILSRSINCTHTLANGDPCNACESCEGILNGTIMDVSEIDAASNNSVDSIRNIRNEVVYAPANVAYRVYIIDEAHMLTTAAFNALLKTLEEPPPHVIFILATTEANKIPATVQSRCQRFDFRRITVGDIANRLLEITEKDKINITPEALRKVAALAEGSMRDALSILDQCTTLGEITLEDVESLVGVAGDSALMDIADSVLQGDAGKVLTIVDEMLQKGKDTLNLLDSVLNYFRELLICKTVSEPEKILIQTAEQTKKRAEQASNFQDEMLIYAIRELSSVIASAKWSANPRVLLEAGMVKLCKPELSDSKDAILARIAKLEQNPYKTTSFAVENKTPHPVDKSVEIQQYKEREEQAVVENPVNSVDKSEHPVGNLKNAEQILQKIRGERPRMHPNLLGSKAHFEDGALIIIQPNNIPYQFLSKPENLAFMEQIAGCKVKVQNGIQTNVENVKIETDGIKDLLAQKEIFGDKMTIMDE